ncbi:T9SS type A sorting domain-containing protein [Neolewinella agarilytica]|uniref:Por secretion system C-terminal sorting domain-containing protein n=1 Tax=Neolewinella agarilytica TaxID=478744 RepID=A0A1H9HAG0_9BACT|nr:T9SS type A sorting domain-containing protein [Neolewinella agarilytica]SEQ59227.1 Por secretion system C-terminal sorting domain-containing protein [Neolewinella agarilytica]
MKHLIIFAFLLLGIHAVSAKDISTVVLPTYGSEYGDEKPESAVSVIMGLSVEDDGCDGVYDSSLDQLGVGFVFYLLDNATGNIIATTQSDASGRFEFTNLMAGDYTVRAEQAFGWFSTPISVTVGASGVQSITYFNCRLEFPTVATCVYGDTTAGPANTHNEKGFAIASSGGLFSTPYTHMFSSVNTNAGVVSDEDIVGKRWDNATNNIDPIATLNDFVDSDPGEHRIENLQVVKTDMPCHGGAFAGVGTVNNGVNKDVFYTEYNTNGLMTFYTDVTSTAAPDQEVVHELIKADNDELIWVGTQRAASTFPNFNELMLSRLNSCTTPVTNVVFGFRDNTGQVPVTGRSVFSLETPLPGYPDAKYAVTGSMGNKVYLFLLAADFTQRLTKAYDIDGDGSTEEEGIRIRRIGDELVILGNSLQRGPLGFLQEQKLFMLKLGFSGQPGLPVVLTNKLYDLPGGSEEIVDAEVDFNGDLILTGTSALLNVGVVNVGAPENQKTFLMGLDPFGNQLWLNQVLLSEGSEPTDLLLGGIFNGGIQVTGSCWTNELINNGGIIVNTRKFDEMLIRADLSGALAFNSGCANSLVASVTEPSSVVSDFIADADTPMFTIIDGGISTDEYFTKAENCRERDVDDFSCAEDLRLSFANQETDSLCCFQSAYFNDSPVPVYELCLKVSGSVMFTDVFVEPTFSTSVNAAANEIKIRSATGPALPPGEILEAINFCVLGAGGSFGINYFWKDINGDVICEEGEELESCPEGCEADFSWTLECGDLQLDGIANGSGLFTYEWDINCDDPAMPELTGQSVSWTLTTGTYDICLKVTNEATGCTATAEQQVTFENEPPVLTCPDTTVILIADAGECYATHDAIFSVMDDCNPNPTVFSFTCNSGNRVAGNAAQVLSTHQIPVGTDCVIVNARDGFANGNSRCRYEVLVLDQEAPACPFPPTFTAQTSRCGDGVEASWPENFFDDNCTGEITYSYDPTGPGNGDFFPLGTTAITAFGTDTSGNRGECLVNVVVERGCGTPGQAELKCREGGYVLEVPYSNDSGSSNADCSFQATINHPAFPGSYPGNGSAIPGMVVFFLTTDELILDPFVTFNMTTVCQCDDGAFSRCSYGLNAEVECCLELHIPDTVICETQTFLEVPIIDLTGLTGITQVRYYVADAGAGSFGTPLQITNGYQPLDLAPTYHTGNIVVYAEVDFAGSACTTVTTNVANIQRCSPVTGSVPAQEYCFDGTPIQPDTLRLTLSGGDPTLCGDSIQWYDPEGVLIPGATGLTYLPGILSLPTGTMDCDQRFVYTAQITSVCGTTTATAEIRLFNENDPVGELTLDPLDDNPLCPGEDAILHYAPACTGDDMMWTWWESTDGVNYVQIVEAGSQNPVYYTNRLYEDTWFQVRKQSGVCAEDLITLFLDIREELTLIGFDAAFDDVCLPSSVTLSAQVNFPADCPQQVLSWYRNGVLLATTNTLSYLYVPAAGEEVAGNYEVLVGSPCCDQEVRSSVISLTGPPTVAIAGPCFICNSNPAELAAVIEGATIADVSLQWYADGMMLQGETGATLEIFDHTGDVYTLEMTDANGCVSQASFTPYERCFIVGVDDLPLIEARVFPNPASDRLFLEMMQPVSFRELTLYDALGRPVRQVSVELPQERIEVSLQGLAAGVYFLQGFTEQGVLRKEVVVE